MGAIMGARLGCHMLIKGWPLSTFECSDCSDECVFEAPSHPTNPCVKKDTERKMGWRPDVGPSPGLWWICDGPGNKSCDKKCRCNSMTVPIGCLFV